MTLCRPHPRRRGAIMPILVVSLIGLCGFVALAVDLGMLAVSRTDCQNAADAAAMAGARTLNNKPGVTDSNRPAALSVANTTVTNNYNLSTNFTAAQVQSVRAGQYAYNTTSQKFVATYPTSIPTGQSWTAMEVVLSTQQPTFFLRVFGVNGMPSGARAVAVHRPRDIALVIDMTGSMGYGSLTNIATGLNDPNTMWPQSSHYQRYAAYSTNALTGAEDDVTVGNRPNPLRQMGQAVSAPYVYAPANLTIETPNGQAIVRDFVYVPTNIADPSVPVTTADGTNLRNAFHQWNPGESGANPTNYVGPTYDFTGYNPLDTSGTSGALPAPDNFKDQSDTPIPFAGDKSPRKYGAATGTTWSPTNSNGAAITAAEYLGWVSRYTSGSSLPSGFPSSAAPTGSGSPARDWTNFRDALWERYGYDLDVADYVANRGSSWDPRFDWDKKANSGNGGWAHQRSSNPTATFRPTVTEGKFKGYTMGPGYFGKTFVVWPPDPRDPVGNPGDSDYQPGDWRRRYFNNRSGGSFNNQGDNDSSVSNTQTVNMELFTNGTGSMLRGSSGNWQVNYPAVLRWIKSGPMVLPPNLRSGRVLYYSSIPNTVTASGSDSADVAADKVFWRAYIDYVITTGALAGTEPMGWPEGVSPSVSQSATTAYDVDATGSRPADPRPYMNYLDNPSRPRLHFWFGPITMMMFLNEYNMWSGTTHQAQSWQLKAGVNSALDDIRNNHPNDLCGMAFFSNNDYNSIIVPMGPDWPTLKNSLFFPRSLLTSIPTTPTAEWRPYDATDGLQTTRGNIPNAQGSTDPVTGLALAYNLLSPSPNVNSDVTKRGRRGAVKMVIFETDGIPNSTRPFNLQKKGYDSYYLFGGSTPNTNAQGAAYDVVDQIVKPVASVNTANTDSGFSLPNAPARVYAIGFGDIFSTTAGPSAESFLLNIQKKGGTSPTSASNMPTSQIITGPYQTRINNLRTALERICQSGVQVTLIE